MKITYQASDGYAGGSRPLHCSIPDEDIKYCRGVDEAMEMIEEAIQDDFLNKVSPSWDDSLVRKQVEDLLRK